MSRQAMLSECFAAADKIGDEQGQHANNRADRRSTDLDRAAFESINNAKRSKKQSIVGDGHNARANAKQHK
jgi:hypothetical protein